MKYLKYILPIVVVISIYTQVGLYSVQPIGALPQGVTAVVRRIGDEPFFNSPDATSIRRTGGVSLFTRMAALANSPLKDRLFFRLPYMEWAYLASTDGKTFSK